MTERLYYTDAYLTDFDAAVVARSDDRRRIYLDRTAFYPTSGGQPFDTGWLGDAAVTDVVDEGDRIAHVLAAPIPGERIHGRVDWPRRFDHMQQHTGQHLLSAVVAGRFGVPTVSVHFGTDASTLDLETGGFSPEQTAEAEARANQAVTDNRPVVVSFEDAASAPGLRKTPGREGILRIVTIEGLDRSACGGTHVRATGEIGPILIRKVERVKQLVRLEFVCGARAVRRARADAELLAALARAQSAGAEELPVLLEAQRAELKAATQARRALEEALAGYRARELHASLAPDTRGRRVALVREAGGPLEPLRALAQAYGGLPGGIIVGVVERPAAVVLGASADSGVDAGAVLKAALAASGGRGGGNARVAQGSVKPASELEAVIAALLAAVGAEAY
ncbi:MAG TPA: DHHA1 domain-containing protein [Gemmatimonadales bacterium]|nr:DHHA1 domain-containing protein [Gemmatimonadales bacterium]